jgi:hypothetical protein
MAEFLPQDAPEVHTQIAEIFQSIAQQYPQLMEQINRQLVPGAQSELAASQAVSPAYAQMMDELYAKYAPSLARTGASVDAISRLGAAQTDSDILGQYGVPLASSWRAAESAASPEAAATRATAATKLGQLLNSIDLNSANPEAERLVNQENIRSGNIATPSATNTVSNALSFGNELQKRRDALSNAIGTATNFIPAATSSFNPAANAVSRGASNTGVSQFTGVKGASNTAANTLGQALQVGSEANKAYSDWQSQMPSIMESMTPDSVSI